MWISKYFVYFVVFSFIGWVYETLLDTIRGGKWENRGFLFGPICPIYGVGADAIIIIASLITSHTGSETSFKWWQIFLVSFFGSMVLEYVTSWVLEKRFHAIWWDYSKVPLNLNGRICVPAAFGFGVAGIFVVYIVAPAAANASDMVPPIVLEGLSLIFMALITVDVTLTVSALTNFTHYMAELDEKINAHMDAFVMSIQEKSSDMSDRLLEEREKFTLENAKNLLSVTGDTYHSAVKRVREFHFPKVEPRKLELTMAVFRQKIGETGVAVKEKIGETGVAVKDKIGETGVAVKEKIASFGDNDTNEETEKAEIK